VASAYARGQDIVAAEPSLREAFAGLAAGLLAMTVSGAES
jgi:hypothetical protein